MGPESRKRPPADVQQTDGRAVPMEYNDSDYFHEVLQLESGTTEGIIDDALAQEAEELGIAISRPATPANHEQDVTLNSISESAVTVGSNHARTRSSGSQGSNSTGITSTSSKGQSDNTAGLHTKRRSMARRSLSFAEYDNYILQTEAQDNALRVCVSPPIPMEPTPSIFSRSSKRSLNSMRSIKSFKNLRNGMQSKFGLRRNYATKEDMK